MIVCQPLGANDPCLRRTVLGGIYGVVSKMECLRPDVGFGAGFWIAIYRPAWGRPRGTQRALAWQASKPAMTSDHDILPNVSLGV